MSRRHIFNFSYNDLDEKAFALLVEAKVVTQGCTWDEHSRLPFVSRDMRPTEIQEKVVKLVQEVEITDGDVVVVGGVPDVAIYVWQAVVDEADVIVLSVIGRKNTDGYRVLGFREVIPHRKLQGREPYYVA